MHLRFACLKDARNGGTMIDTGLKNKAVVVTGGAAGIGKGTALAFAAEGCRVAVWDVKGDEAEIVASIAYVTCDARDHAACVPGRMHTRVPVRLLRDGGHALELRVPLPAPSV